MWTVTFKQDTRVAGVGTMQAIHDSPAVSYSRRVDTSRAPDIAAFISEARAALTQATDEQGSRTGIAATVAASLNS